jgi:hypothetical protein
MYHETEETDPFQNGGHSSRGLRSVPATPREAREQYVPPEPSAFEDSAESASQRRRQAAVSVAVVAGSPPPKPLQEGSQSGPYSTSYSPTAHSEQASHPEPPEVDAPPESQYVRVLSDDEPTYNNKAARVYIFGLSGLLMVAGVAIAVMARVEIDYKFLALCPECDQFAVALYIAGSTISFIGFIGFLSALTRRKPIAFLNAFIMCITSVFFFAVGVAVLVFEFDLSKNNVRTMWKSALDDESQMICDLQNRFQCSGFDKCCAVWNVTAPFNVTNSQCGISSLAEYVEQCDTRCTDSNQMYLDSCDNEVTDLVKSHFAPLAGVTFTLCVIFFVGCVLSVRMVLHAKPARRSLSP